MFKKRVLIKDDSLIVGRKKIMWDIDMYIEILVV